MNKCINTYYNNVTFGSGLTQKTARTISSLSAAQLSDEFVKVYKIDANFKENNVIAACSAICADIYENLSKTFKLPLASTPKRIRVFTPEDLIKPQRNSFGFCIADTKKVLKSEPPFELKSIFFQQHKLSVNDIDDITEEMHKKGINSTNHFLYEYIHEWAHNVHLDWIYNRYGYDGLCPYGRKVYQSEHPRGLKIVRKMHDTKFSSREKEVISNTVGTYAAESNPFELFAETMAKLICDSLDNDTLLPKKNPFDGFSDFSEDFRDIFIKNTYF